VSARRYDYGSAWSAEFDCQRRNDCCYRGLRLPENYERNLITENLILFFVRGLCENSCTSITYWKRDSSHCSRCSTDSLGAIV
jgi:hypothetical protein